MKFKCGNCGNEWVEDVIEFNLIANQRRCPDCNSNIYHKIGYGTKIRKAELEGQVGKDGNL